MASMVTYIKKLTNKYENARAQYETVFEEYGNIMKAKSELQKKHREYSAEGYKKRKADLDAKEEQVTNRLRNIPADFNSSVETLREEVKAAFKSKYGVDLRGIDGNAVAFINSGVLTDEEMADLADQYRDNATMLKLIGGKLKQSKNIHTQALGDVILEKSNAAPHLKIFDSMAYICKNGLRVNERDCGIGCTPEEGKVLSDGVHESLYPETLENTMAAAAEITTD